MSPNFLAELNFDVDRTGVATTHTVRCGEKMAAVMRVHHIAPNSLWWREHDWYLIHDDWRALFSPYCLRKFEPGFRMDSVISSLWVEPGYRGLGIARKLLRQLLADASEEATIGVCASCVISERPNGTKYTDTDLSKLVKLYREFGFEIVGLSYAYPNKLPCWAVWCYRQLVRLLSVVQGWGNAALAANPNLRKNMRHVLNVRPTAFYLVRKGKACVTNQSQQK